MLISRDGVQAARALQPIQIDLAPARTEHVVSHDLGRPPFVRLRVNERLVGVQTRILDAYPHDVILTAPEPFSGTLALL